MNIEHRLSGVLSEFARTLLTEFSIQSILDHLVVRIVDVLPISGAGMTLISPGTAPRYIAASDDQVLGFEGFQSELDEGPWLLAYTSGEAVAVPDLRLDDRFPRFSARAQEAGLTAVFAFPLKAGDDQIGALDLYRTTAGALTEEEMAAAQTLADVAAAYLLNAQARVDLEQSLERTRQSSLHDDLAVDALRDSEARKKGILDSVLDSVITIDEHGRIVEFNPAAERTFGYSLQEALGRELADLIIPEADRHAHRQGIQRYLATGESRLVGQRIEMSPIRSDGSSFPAEVTISSVVTPGPPLFTGSVRDLTQQHADDAERLVLESRLHQTERLESLGQLAGGVAHDFNNLLTVILNYAAFISQSAPEHSPTKSYAGEILASAERAAALTKQLLMYARREPVRRTALDLNAIVADVRELLARTIGEDVKIDVQGATDLPPIDADRGQIEQVLINLSVNARDAMPDGGTFTIETALLEIGADEAGSYPGVDPGRYVRLSVIDGGVGMSAEVAARAFDPFFSTKPRGEGTGLGLATVYGIVADTGGAVNVQSQEGLGTTVRVFFPASSQRSAMSPETDEDVVVGAGETVLIVEDQQAVREVIIAMLRRNGYQVLSAAGAREALVIAADADFDLLLTDVVMPEMSGRGLVEALRDQRGDHQVLFMSGYSGAAFLTERFLEPAEALIHKPFNETALLQAVDDALHRKDVSRRASR
ncbi:MAG: PAS domain S-box protein [Ilumatobacteraceae bacterium]